MKKEVLSFIMAIAASILTGLLMAVVIDAPALNIRMASAGIMFISTVIPWMWLVDAIKSKEIFDIFSTMRILVMVVTATVTLFTSIARIKYPYIMIIVLAVMFSISWIGTWKNMKKEKE